MVGPALEAVIERAPSVGGSHGSHTPTSDLDFGKTEYAHIKLGLLRYVTFWNVRSETVDDCDPRVDRLALIRFGPTLSGTLGAGGRGIGPLSSRFCASCTCHGTLLGKTGIVTPGRVVLRLKSLFLSVCSLSHHTHTHTHTQMGQANVLMIT